MENITTSPTEPETERQKLVRHMRSVFEEIDAYLDENDDRKRDDLAEAMAPLCVTKQIELHVQLAWGGPSYGFKLYYDPEARDFVNGLFYYANRFTYEEQWLSGRELDRVVDAYGLYPERILLPEPRV